MTWLRPNHHPNYVHCTTLKTERKTICSDSQLTETAVGNRQILKWRSSSRVYPNPAERSPCTWVSTYWRRRDGPLWSQLAAAADARVLSPNAVALRPLPSRPVRSSPSTPPASPTHLPSAPDLPPRRSWSEKLLSELRSGCFWMSHNECHLCSVAVPFYRVATVTAGGSPAPEIYINSLPNCRWPGGPRLRHS